MKKNNLHGYIYKLEAMLAQANKISDAKPVAVASRTTNTNN